MKRILTGLVALAISGMVLAGTVTIEGSAVNTVGGNDQSRAKFAISESINKTFSVSGQLTSTQTDNTNSIGTRLEIGGTAAAPLFGSVKGYTKISLGQKYGNFGSFTYYSIEPGFTMPLSSNLTTKVGYRFRSAVENANINKDTTETLRVGVTYAINKRDAVGLRFDRITGDSRQDGYNLFYSRSF